MSAFLISSGILFHTRATEYDKLLLNMLNFVFVIVKCLFDTERRLKVLLSLLILKELSYITKTNLFKYTEIFYH